LGKQKARDLLNHSYSSNSTIASTIPRHLLPTPSLLSLFSFDKANNKLFTSSVTILRRRNYIA
jgi:hypothetical protein